MPPIFLKNWIDDNIHSPISFFKLKYSNILPIKRIILQLFLHHPFPFLTDL